MKTPEKVKNREKNVNFLVGNPRFPAKPAHFRAIFNGGSFPSRIQAIGIQRKDLARPKPQPKLNCHESSQRTQKNEEYKSLSL